ncbi:4-aminobutyrate--pyruvate transaminase [Hasllibacter halocynthiae]|uniref:4-aminobutyrate--pyruvate transaminase n=2 Tax=Hasllibacter halocynthiae TaxID=595589 RepID=A0A2T0X9H5_9RHOB|nr:4-aminobutyrate--pyruvate transaminase [Hasllibacter halocynthiae]
MQLYPFTDPAAGAPRQIVAGEGAWVTDADGNRFLDAVAGLWCASLGFSDERLARAAYDQIRTLGYYHSFKNRSAKPADDLAAKLVEMTPGSIARVFLACGGSEAVDTAVKLARSFRIATEEPGRMKVIARTGAYHGSLGMSASLTGMGYVHDGFALPGGVVRVGRPHPYRDKHPNESDRQLADRLARELDETIRAEGAETICAMIGEPVMGAGGVIIPPEGYWPAMREVLRAHGIHFIADEVICGFGRLGTWFGSDHYDLAPDLMTMAKQLSAAMSPVSAVGLSAEVADALDVQSARLGTFGHGVTYGGHPAACAVALEAIRIHEEMDAPKVARQKGEALGALLERFRGMPGVGDVRRLGFIAAVEIAPDAGFGGAEVGAEAEARGVFFRIIGDTLAMCPPYVATDEDLRRMTDVLEASIKACRARAAA